MVMRLSPSREMLNEDLKPQPYEGAQPRHTSLGIGQRAMPKVHPHLKRTKTTLEQKRSIRKQIDATKKTYSTVQPSPAASKSEFKSMTLTKDVARGVVTSGKEAEGDYHSRDVLTPKLKSKSASRAGDVYRSLNIENFSDMRLSKEINSSQFDNCNGKFTKVTDLLQNANRNSLPDAQKTLNNYVNDSIDLSPRLKTPNTQSSQYRNVVCRSMQAQDNTYLYKAALKAANRAEAGSVCQDAERTGRLHLDTVPYKHYLLKKSTRGQTNASTNFDARSTNSNASPIGQLAIQRPQRNGTADPTAMRVRDSIEAKSKPLTGHNSFRAKVCTPNGT